MSVFALILGTLIVFFLTLTLYIFYQHSRYSHIPGPKRANFYTGNLPHFSAAEKEGKGPCELWYSWALEHGGIFVFWIFHNSYSSSPGDRPRISKKVFTEYQFAQSRASQLCKRSADQETKIKELSAQNAALKTQVGNLQSAFVTQQATLNDLEQYGRRDCLEIRGIPLTPQENTNELVCKVASLAEVEIGADDISTSHRIKPKSNTGKFPPAIIVKFICRDARDGFYKARSRLRGYTTRDLDLGRASDNQIYISESLTESNKKLFKDALKLRKDLKYKYIWSNYGNIYLRRDEDSHAVHVKNAEILAGLRENAGQGQH